MRNHNSPFDHLMVIATALSGKGKNFALLCILCTPLIFMVSCRKENEENIPNPQGNNGAGITATYVIQVFDNQMQALNGVKVRLAGTEGFTETDGTLLLSADNWPTGSLTLKATRTGYFKKIHTIDSRPGVHTVRIVLQEDVLAGSFNASVGGMVNLPQGGTITFTAGSIIDFSGEPFQGIVNVFASYLDPTSSLSWDYMPNAYLGKSLDGNEYFLENHGAIIAELRDGMGMPLQIADNYTATLSIPNGNFEQGSPPPTLPLYSFNESQGIWLEEGLAELSGNYYTGEVGHFSFWMCPYYYDHHFISGSLACAGTALGSTEVSVYNQWGAFLGSVSSDNGGGFSGMVPEGMPLTLRVNDPCGGEVLSEAIGPFFESDYMEPIDVCAGNANYSSVSGVAEDCDGSGIPGALCFIQSNGILDVLTANASGEFQGSVLFCASSQEFSAVGYASLSGESSAVQVYDIAPVQNVGSLNVCENPEQYVQFTLDGTPYYFVPGEFAEFQASYNPVQDRIHLGVIGGQFMNETQFGLLIEGSIPGTYSVGGHPFAYSFWVQGTDGSVYLNVDITEAGNSIGAMVEGSIEDGQFNDAEGISHALSNCSFRMAINYIIE